MTSDYNFQKAQRKPLTDEQIFALSDSLDIWDESEERWVLDSNAFARAIEAAHGIKEHTMDKSTNIQGKDLTTPPAAPAQQRLTDEQVCLIAHNMDSNDWNSLDYREVWYKGFKAGFREAEVEHNIGSA